ncbi:MAG TPA: TonB-dependent receptor, partial [Burkholderiaceae bacterium]|nr:TonB-dependent receptor [Burkholderiaceae bacterium]
TGFDVAGSFDLTQKGGGNSGEFSIAAGTGRIASDGYNLFAVLSYQKQQALHGDDRSSTSSANRPDLDANGLSPFTFPSNIVDRRNQRILNPSRPDGCAPPSSVPTLAAPFFTPACGFDYAPLADTLPEVERTSLIARGTLRLTPTADLYGEALIGRNVFKADIAPYPLPQFPTAFGTPVYPASGPYYPTDFAAANDLSGPLLFSWRAIQLGPRHNETTGDAQRYLLGVEGSARGWDYSVAAVYNANQQQVFYSGSYMYQSRLISALRSGLVNPWGTSGPEGNALLAAAQYTGTPQTADASTSLINAFASKEIALLPAGPLALAVGGEVRSERLSYDWDPAILSGESPIGDELKAISGARMAYALFAELNIPILPKLEAQLALRYDAYSDFGSTTNPKVALRWQPATSLLLRGSWGTGFRAPPLYNLSEPSSTSGFVGPIADPVRCPVTGSPDDCEAFVQVVSGGNPNLHPETSRQWNFGGVWEPLRGLSFGADFWNIRQDGVISPLDPENTANYLRYPDRVTRGPVDPAYPNLPGPITQFDASVINMGATQTSGVDVTLKWAGPPTAVGNFSAALLGTYVLQFDTQINGVSVSLLGNAIDGTPVPRWRSNLTLDWIFGPWGATLAWLYSSGYVESIPSQTPGLQREVGAAQDWDLQGRYTGFAGWQLAAGIRNLLDRAPPFSRTSSFQFGFNPQVASPLGRVFYVRASYSVK